MPRRRRDVAGADGNNVIPRDIIIQREAIVWEYRQKGYTIARIGKETGLDPSTISRYLQRISLRTRKAIEADINRIRFEQVIMLDYIVDQAMQEWEKSKSPSKSLSRRQGTGRARRGRNDEGEDVVIDGENREEVITKVEEQVGDPRFLDQARQGMADIRKILGIDAPTKHIHAIKDLTRLTEEELRQIVEG